MEDFYIQWHITDKCNLRCSHCYQDKFTSLGDPDKDKLKIISDNIISALKKWGKKGRIAITGGEPFLKEEALWLADYLGGSEEISGLNFITNGTMADSHVHSLKGLKKLDEILVSLDGVTEAANDAIRGKAVFEKTTGNIRLLKSEGFNVTVMFTLLKRNYRDAFGLYDFTRELGADGYIIERFIPLGTGGKIRSEAVSGAEVRELYEDIFSRCGAEFDSCESARYHALQVRFEGEDTELLGAECVAGTDGVAVLPDGSVLPCRRFNLPVGNLLKDRLCDLWDSSRVLDEIRNKSNIRGKCGKCGLSDCRGCRAIAFALTGDHLAEDPQCWL